MTDGERPDPAEAWIALVEGLRLSGERLGEQTAGLSPEERADGYRALLRALNNNLGRFEVDRDHPELVAFNGWREKMLMDNPDFRYWVADVRDDGSYRISGTRGDAEYVSITAYRSGGSLEAGAVARIDSDSMTFGPAGEFEVVVAAERPAGAVDWLELVEGTSVVWVRQFHGDVTSDELGSCSIEPIDQSAPEPFIDPERFIRRLERLGGAMSMMPALLTAATAEDLATPNRVRRWTEMAGGAAFTEPGIHYLRGAWRLDEDEALVVEGTVPTCRYWNVLLYSRFCNSLDHRRRRVSFTGATADLHGDRFRFVIAGREPAAPADWLDTEGRPFGLFLFRFLQPEGEPELPTVRVCDVDDLPPVMW